MTGDPSAVRSEVLRAAGCAAEVFRPPPGVAEQPAVLWCLPGGAMSRRYFDLDVPGAADTYSMARWFAAHGHVVVAVDHPGVGDSEVPANPLGLTPDVVADADAACMAEVAEHCDLGGRPSVGVGHSMGGLITCYQQARHRTHDAVALLGFGGAGLPSQLTERELALAHDPAAVRREIRSLAEERFGGGLPVPQRGRRSGLLGNDGLAPEVRDALLAAGAPNLAVCGLTAMIPGASAAELGAVGVPVLLGVGEHDIARPAHEIPQVFPAATDITLFVLAGVGHTHNAAAARAVLWSRLAAWIAGFWGQ